MVIQTSVLARLLGFKLLTLEGIVVASPAQLQDMAALSTARTSDGTARSGDRVPTAEMAADHEPARTGSSARAAGPVGGRLAAAADLLEECSADLSDLEADSPTPQPRSRR